MAYRSFLGSTQGLVVSLILAAAGAWLLWSHTGHVVAALPLLVLLACPLMHVLHRGHRHGGHDHSKSSSLPLDNKPKTRE